MDHDFGENILRHSIKQYLDEICLETFVFRCIFAHFNYIFLDISLVHCDQQVLFCHSDKFSVSDAALRRKLTNSEGSSKIMEIGTPRSLKKLHLKLLSEFLRKKSVSFDMLIYRCKIII